MPEIVEVNWLMNYFSKYKNCNVVSIIDKNSSEKIINQKILDVNSKGKFMWFKLENLYLKFTFGLTGILNLEPDKYTKYTIKLKNEDKELLIYFNDKLSIGSNLIIDNDISKVNKLGDDLLKNPLTYDKLKERLNYLIKKNKKEKKIIQILFEQDLNKGIGSGLGNYLICEILYRAKINPHTTINAIINDNDKLNNLLDSINYILKLSYLTNNLGYFNKLSLDIKNFILERRNEIILNENKLNENKLNENKLNEVFEYCVYKQKITRNNEIVKKEKIINNRTCYYVI